MLYTYPGKDNYLHRVLRRWYKVAQSQAQYRHQPWLVPWELFRDLWLTNQNYRRRGRGSDQLSFSRLDNTLPWSPDNVTIMTRREYMRLTQGQPDGPKIRNSRTTKHQGKVLQTF